MIRRTHGDSLFGAKLLDLKPPSKHDHIVHLSKIEREIYEVVRRRFVARINGFIKTGNLQKRYSNVLTMLLRRVAPRSPTQASGSADPYAADSGRSSAIHCWFKIAYVTCLKKKTLMLSAGYVTSRKIFI